MKIVEGYMPFKGYQTYYRIVGECEEGKLPLLALHGGPGCNHSYLESLDAIAEKYGRQVIYYDQVGCGKSPVPHGNADFYEKELWMEELAEIRKHLKLDNIHLLGQSWGGMLEMLYMTQDPQPEGIASMVIASSPASVPLWVEEANRLLSYLPQEMQDALAEADRTGDYSAPLAQEGMAEYYRRHVCKLDPYPEFVQRTFDDDSECGMIMQGASEFVATGKLKNFDVTADLPRITIPVLVTSGENDEATPKISQQIVDLIPDCGLEIIPGGTHMCHCEYPELYNEIIEKFMEAHE